MNACDSCADEATNCGTSSDYCIDEYPSSDDAECDYCGESATCAVMSNCDEY